jgi:hypothetical protein
MTESNELIAVIFDGVTGQTISRPFTEEEQDLAKSQVALSLEEQELKEAKKLARESALGKLAALGLTEEEIAAL